MEFVFVGQPMFSPVGQLFFLDKANDQVLYFDFARVLKSKSKEIVAKPPVGRVMENLYLKGWYFATKDNMTLTHEMILAGNVPSRKQFDRDYQNWKETQNSARARLEAQQVGKLTMYKKGIRSIYAREN